MQPSLFKILHSDAKSILSPTSGFIAQAGFTHSLNPARNCTFGCTYCYVPTMRVQAGLKAEDWQRWGQFTTFKVNSPELLRKELRHGQVIYCSPLVDPYQPAERIECLMPRILTVLLAGPPRVFVIQTRGVLILRDLELLKQLSQRITLRVSFSVTTDREDVRRWYEPLCDPIFERLDAVRALRRAGIETYVTVAPVLPCDPRRLIAMAVDASGRDIIGDPFHVKAVKAHGAFTRDAANRISEKRGFLPWHDPQYMDLVIQTMQGAAATLGRRFGIGPEAFGWLARPGHAAGAPQP